MLFAVLIPITILVVIGYFVLASSAKADGSVRAFGKYLATWTFVLAALLFVGAATAPMFGGRPFGMRGGMMIGDHMRGMMDRSGERGMKMDMNRHEHPNSGDQGMQTEPGPSKD